MHRLVLLESRQLEKYHVLSTGYRTIEGMAKYIVLSTRTFGLSATPYNPYIDSMPVLLVMSSYELLDAMIQ